MKLRPGDQIWVTPKDDRAPGALPYIVRTSMFVEWDGEKFLGCTMVNSGERHEWPQEVLLRYMEACNETRARTNIDCMVEQLVADGSIGG